MNDPEQRPVFQPLYLQIKEMLSARLQSGEWKPGGMIPSEMELAAGFGVSQGTVRKAIDVLVQEKILVRRQGKGTFVATHSGEWRTYHFLRISGAEDEPESPLSRLIDVTRIKAGVDVARRLDVAPGSTLVVIRRILSFSDGPVIYDEVHVPGSLFKGLSVELIERYEGRLYRMFEQEYGVRVVHATENLRAVLPGPEELAHLQVSPGTPLLRVERVAYSYGGKPVEWRKRLFDTSRHHYVNELR